MHFYDLARLLGSEQPFYGLSALGLEKGQVPHTQIEDMAAHYIKEIRTIQFKGPYYLGGSGAGCPIVLEMAHQLESQGQKVTLLVLVSPTPLPIMTNKSHNTPFYYYNYLRRYSLRLIELLRNRPLLPNIKHVFLNRVLWHWRIFHRYIPGDLHRRRRYVDDFIRALMKYEPEAYHGRITSFLREEFSDDHKKGLGDWYDLAVGGLDVQFVPGNIFTMWREPHIQILSEKLTACLNEAQKNS